MTILDLSEQQEKEHRSFLEGTDYVPPKRIHCMLDIETWGTANHAVIISIGAVKFDPNGTGFEDLFYVAIDPRSCQKFGLKIDAETVLWWMSGERAEARGRWLDDEKHELSTALDGFVTWFGGASMPVWSLGAVFDLVILKSAFQAVGMKLPWSYRDENCFRTLRALGIGVEGPLGGVYHNALDDAKNQARHMQDIVEHLGLVL